MKRILIIGSNGAGKSTFSFKLAEKLGLPLVHIDQIYWRGNWDVTPENEFDCVVSAETSKPAWIIEGNNFRSLTHRLARADTVFWFEFPPPLCVLNILRRERKYCGQVRPDMPDECVSRWDLAFLKIVWEFNKKNHARIEKLLGQHKHFTVIRFTNYRQVKRYMEQL